MKKISVANFRRLCSYLKRNGLQNTLDAAAERLLRKENYTYEDPSGGELKAQRSRQWREKTLLSIVTPAYRTREDYLRDLIDSVLAQTYPYLELVVADASGDGSVEQVVRTYQDERLCYLKLEQNAGIAENTNRGIEACRGQYIGLLDHDDVLAPHALYEMALRIETGREKGRLPMLLYSDEDKCSFDRSEYFEPHRKVDFNLELLLSNNYICHFLLMDAGLMKSCMLRPEYDGAQDFDLVLRAAGKLLDRQELIVHVPKILYHWRCHEASTAQNPESKSYAYQAGRRALEDFAREMGWEKVRVRPDRHMGFYRQEYIPDYLSVRNDVGAVGGRILRHGKVAGGIYRDDKTPLYEGLPKGFSGYMNRAAMAQNADAVDIRRMTVRPECRELFRRVTSVPYHTDGDGKYFDYTMLKPGTDYVELSVRLCREIRRAGYRIVWDPEY